MTLHQVLLLTAKRLRRFGRGVLFQLSEMVVEKDKRKVVHGYLSWFRDPMTFGETPEGSRRKRRDQHIIRHLKKELEKAKATIARQEVKVQRGKNNKLELHDMEGELKHVEGRFSPIGGRIA